MKVFLFIVLISLNATSWSQVVSDTVLSGDKKTKFKIEIVPCECDSLKHDSISISNNSCSYTNIYFAVATTILDIDDSICLAIGARLKTNFEIGINESRWRNIYNLSCSTKDDDLRVRDRRLNYYCIFWGLLQVKPDFIT